jgi:hypothetical protein
VVKETLQHKLSLLNKSFNPSRGSGKGDLNTDTAGNLLFQSPLGEVVKETQVAAENGGHYKFQSPLGEVVKETVPMFAGNCAIICVSIPSRGSGKGDQFENCPGCNTSVSIPSRGSGKGD